MKLIVAYVPSGVLARVFSELEKLGIHDTSVSVAHGFGREQHGLQTTRWEFKDIERTKKLRLEFPCLDEDMDRILETIYEAAHTGLPDNGSVFVLPIVDVLRLRTGARGAEAFDGQPRTLAQCPA